MMRAACMVLGAVLVGPLPASAVTYNYVGSPWTMCGDPIPYPSCGNGRLTGSVTFGFDTWDFSGTIDNLSNRGLITTVRPWYPGYESFTFDHAQIIAWSIMPAGGYGYFSNIYHDYELLAGVAGMGNYGGYLASSAPGVWTPVDLVAPVPGPIAGAGLPGLLMAGLLWWKRRRR